MMYISKLEFMNMMSPMMGEIYCLDLPDATFKHFELRARKAVDRLTQGRIKKMENIPEPVSHLMADLIQLELSMAARTGKNAGPVTSFSNDGYSETYAAPLTPEQLQDEQERMILEYLSDEVDDNGVPLLYLGVC